MSLFNAQYYFILIVYDYICPVSIWTRTIFSHVT